MTDGLEQSLVALGRELDFPATPDIAGAVGRRIGRRRRRVWIAAVALAAAVGVAFAVPDSRGALLRFFHLRGATVERVDRLPTLPATLDLGTPVDPDAAAFHLLLLDGRPPDAVYARDGGYWLRYPGALLFEYRTGGGAILKKVAGMAGAVEWVTVDGAPGVWIGVRHAVYLPGGRARTAGHVLLWQRGPLLPRLEADVARADAIRLASRIR